MILKTGWWFGTFFCFSIQLGIIIPTDELIFFRGVGIPATSLIFLNPNPIFDDLMHRYQVGIFFLKFIPLTRPIISTYDGYSLICVGEPPIFGQVKSHGFFGHSVVSIDIPGK